MIVCLESSVLGGYLTNEVPGLVTGLLHLAGVKQPVRIELAGNFLRDIAGCRIDLHNPLPDGNQAEVSRLSPFQAGFAGVVTASYRVAKLPRRRASGGGASPLGMVPIDPNGLKNLLFIEWFNNESQRVLIQSWHLQLRVGAPRWQLSKDDESTFLRQSRARRKHFLLNQRKPNGSPDALHSPSNADPFEPNDPVTDPFGNLGDLPRSSSSENDVTESIPDPAKRSYALAKELRRFGRLLVFKNDLRSQPAIVQLLSTVADLAAHLIHALRQFSGADKRQWKFLVTDLEQSLPLFSAALNATDKVIQHGTPGTDQQWLGNVQASLLNIELRMRELLTLMR